MESVRLCAHCGNPIPHYRSPQATYCSNKCSNKASTIRLGNRCDVEMTRNTRGAISEITVCTDLMEQGYDVYRAMSPSCCCDLVACRDGRLWRVEVKTGQYNKDGTPSKAGPTPRQRAGSDAIAYVMYDGRIFYQPDFTHPE